jgi:hypothetical protein
VERRGGEREQSGENEATDDDDHGSTPVDENPGRRTMWSYRPPSPETRLKHSEEI